MGFHTPRHFSADEKAFVETLARHCAQAFSRASRLEREEQAKRWLGTTLRSIGDAVIATDAEGRVMFMNPVAEALTGWAENEACGRPLAEVFRVLNEETRKMTENPVARVLREGVVVGLANHSVLRSRGGAEMPIDDSGAPIRSEGGHIFGVVLVFRDRSFEKRDRARTEFLAKAGEALASSIDFQRTLATVARFAVPLLADWCAVHLVGPSNPQVAVAHLDEEKTRLARELAVRFPLDPDAPLGPTHAMRTGVSEIYPDISPELLRSLAAQLSDDEEYLRFISDLRIESAMVVPLRVRERTFGSITFLYAESGRRYTRDDLAFAEDFAHRAAMAIENALALKRTADAQALERTLRGEAERVARAKDEFLATVSHELRTPLNAILGWTLTLRRRRPPEEVDRGLAVVERNARLQTKLIEDVLDISRIISGKLALNLGPTKISDAVSAAVEAVTPAAEAKEIVTTTDIADANLAMVADADRLQQIVWNLASNAVKFTPKGGRVIVSAYREGSEICIRVADTGEGIPREALPHVFEPFRQADASTTRRHGGLGLGLAIVAQLVAAHGGTVSGESEGEGKGATFLVRLPARSALPAVGRTTLVNTGAHRAIAVNDPGPRLDGLRLLVVDDEKDSLELMTELLRLQGAEVCGAASAHEALERFDDARPDVIVSDLGMPEMDGLALIRKIRELPADRGGRTPAVALTAYARGEDAERAFAAGFQMHVAKPSEPARLATIVANLGGRSLAAV
jgi:PAS domain S-box-containing protein